MSAILWVGAMVVRLLSGFVQSIGIRELEENIALQILNNAGRSPGLRTPVQINFDIKTSATAISKRKASSLHQSSSAKLNVQIAILCHHGTLPTRAVHDGRPFKSRG